MTTLQDRLRHARKEAQLTQGEVASRSGLSQSTIAQIESGRNSGTRFADKLAEALNVSVDWLLTGQGLKPTDLSTAHPKRRAMDADEWLFLDLVAPKVTPGNDQLEWVVLEPQALRIHRSFFRSISSKPEDCRVLVADGDTMQPYLNFGDWYVVDLTITDLTNKMTAFIRPNGECYVTRVRRLPDGGVRLIELNTEEPPFDFAPGEAENKLKVLGRIIFRTTPPTYQYQLR
jgi:transcriptional regulator with XRE-family HTH domain